MKTCLITNQKARLADELPHCDARWRSWRRQRCRHGATMTNTLAHFTMESVRVEIGRFAGVGGTAVGQVSSSLPMLSSMHDMMHACHMTQNTTARPESTESSKLLYVLATVSCCHSRWKIISSMQGGLQEAFMWRSARQLAETPRWRACVSPESITVHPVVTAGKSSSCRHASRTRFTETKRSIVDLRRSYVKKDATKRDFKQYFSPAV